jgi:hypothetical protein
MTSPGDASQSKARAIAHILVWVVLAIPGSFSAVRGCDAASRITLAKIVEEKAREI